MANMSAIFINMKIPDSENHIEPLQLMAYEDDVEQTFEESLLT